MQQAREPFHVEVKRYLVKPLSVKQRSPHASPRVAAHARHARTNKELVSLAMHESQAQKNPGNLAATGARRLEVELKLGERRPSVLTEPRGNFAETDWLPALILDHIDDDAAYAVVILVRATIYAIMINRATHHFDWVNHIENPLMKKAR